MHDDFNHIHTISRTLFTKFRLHRYACPIEMETPPPDTPFSFPTESPHPEPHPEPTDDPTDEGWTVDCRCVTDDEVVIIKKTLFVTAISSFLILILVIVSSVYCTLCCCVPKQESSRKPKAIKVYTIPNSNMDTEKKEIIA